MGFSPIEVSSIVLDLIFRSEPLRAQRSTIVRSIPYSKQDVWSAPQSVTAAATAAAAAFNGSRGWDRGGGVSASAAAAATAAAAAFNGSRGRDRGGGASASAAAAATAAAAAFNGSRGRGRGGGDTATAAVATARAGTVGVDRRSGCGDFGGGPVDTSSRKAHRRWNHSRRGVWSGNGGGDIHEGAAGPPGGAVVFAWTATAAAVPCDTGGHEIEIVIEFRCVVTVSTPAVWLARENIKRLTPRPCINVEYSHGVVYMEEEARRALPHIHQINCPVSRSYIYQTPLVHDSPVTRTQSSIENLVPETHV